MKPVIALDIETTGLNPWRDEILICGLWDGKQYAAAREPHQPEGLLYTLYKDHDIVGHRTDFDIKFLQVKNWLVRNIDKTIHDTRIIGSLVKDRVPRAFLDRYEEHRKELNKTLPKGVTHREGSPLSLKVMAPWYLKVPPFWETPGDHNNEEYNQKDCMYTYRLYLLLSERLKAEGSWDFYEKRMLEWSKMVREMELKGICISMEELDKVEQEYTVKRDQHKTKLDNLWAEAHLAYQEKQREELRVHYYERRQARLDKLAAQGKLTSEKTEKITAQYFQRQIEAEKEIELRINYASPSQMSWLLKDYLGLDITDMDGEESTGKAVLNRLAAEDREDIKTFLEWREADKVLTMYVPTYRELQVDGVIHPSFNLTGTRTGRTSSSGPNLQQVPPKLYRLFKPRPGHKFIQYDLSGIEAALIALYSGDSKLYEILEKGESIHDHNAKAMFGLDCPVNEVSTKFPKERKTVKNIGFACFYGAGWRRISKVFAAGGFPISDAEAKAKLKLLRSYYPKAFEFHREVTEVFERGETVTNLFGRPINLQPHENPYMQGFNTLIQSSASDLNLRACEIAWKKWDKSKAYPLLVIHDCIIAEAEAGYAEEAEQILIEAMTGFKLESDNGPIKLRVEGGISDNWEK